MHMLAYQRVLDQVYHKPIPFCSVIYSFLFNQYLKLVFTIVIIKILIQTNYLQKKKKYIIPKLPAYFAGAFITSPVFDPLFKSRKFWLIFDAII